MNDNRNNNLVIMLKITIGTFFAALLTAIMNPDPSTTFFKYVLINTILYSLTGVMSYLVGEWFYNKGEIIYLRFTNKEETQQ